MTQLPQTLTVHVLLTVGLRCQTSTIGRQHTICTCSFSGADNIVLAVLGRLLWHMQCSTAPHKDGYHKNKPPQSIVSFFINVIILLQWYTMLKPSSGTLLTPWNGAINKTSRAVCQWTTQQCATDTQELSTCSPISVEWLGVVLCRTAPCFPAQVTSHSVGI